MNGYKTIKVVCDKACESFIVITRDTRCPDIEVCDIVDGAADLGDLVAKRASLSLQASYNERLDMENAHD